MTTDAESNWLSRILARVKGKAAELEDKLSTAMGDTPAPPAAPPPLPLPDPKVKPATTEASSAVDADGNRTDLIQSSKDGVNTRTDIVTDKKGNVTKTTQALAGSTGVDLSSAVREVKGILGEEDRKLESAEKKLLKATMAKTTPTEEEAAKIETMLTALDKRRKEIQADLQSLGKPTLESVAAVGAKLGLEVKADDPARQVVTQGVMVTIVKKGDVVESREVTLAKQLADGSLLVKQTKVEENKKTVTLSESRADGSKTVNQTVEENETGMLGEGMVGKKNTKSKKVIETDAEGRVASVGETVETKGGLMVDGTALGAGANQSKSSEIATRGGYTGKVTREAGGCYMADIAELEPVLQGAKWIKMYEIKLTLKFNAGMTAGGEKGTGSAEVSGKATAELAFTQRMNETEKNSYLRMASQVDKGGKASGGLPEWKALERMVAMARSTDDAAKAAGALMDSDLALALPEGQAVEFTGGASAGAKAGVKGGSAGASAEGSAQWSASFKVAKSKGADGVPRVTVTVGFTSAESGKATGQVMGAEMSVSKGTSAGDSFSFTWAASDPKFGTQFNELKGFSTPEQVQAFAKANPSLLSERGWSEGESDGVAVGILGESLLEESSKVAKTAKVSGGVVTGTGEAESGVELAQIGGAKAKVNATVDEEGGLTLDVGSAESSAKNPFLTVADAAAGLLDSPSEALEGAAMQVAAKGGVEDPLKELFLKKFEDIKGTVVSPEAMDQVVKRAADKKNWSWCLLFPPDASAAWEKLRQILLAPKPSGEWVAMDASAGQIQSKQLARAHAIADFLRDHGFRAEQAFHQVLHEWGSRGNQDISTAPDLGTQYEWPSELGKEKALFEQAKARVDSAPRTLAGFGGDADAIHTYVNPIFRDLISVQEAVKASTAITDARRKAEMVQQMDGLILSLKGAVADVSPAAPTGVSGPSPTLVANITLAEKELLRMKSEEQRLFKESRSNLRVANGGSIEDGWTGSVGAILSEDTKAAIDLLHQAAELHERWIQCILDLRVLYSEACYAGPNIKVSQSKTDARRLDYEPDVEELIKLHQSVNSAQSYAGAFQDTNDRVYSQWRSRAKY